jgi:hypothetical protein
MLVWNAIGDRHDVAADVDDAADVRRRARQRHRPRPAADLLDPQDVDAELLAGDDEREQLTGVILGA